MTDAREFAHYLCYLAVSGEEADPLTNLRLQKLLYYTQGWSLAERGRPAFGDRIEAWAHGPVAPAVYSEFERFGDAPLATIEPDLPLTGLSDDEAILAAEVWEVYQPYSATRLRQMVHSEIPWVEARLGVGPGERSAVEITPEALAKDFATKWAHGSAV